MQDSCTVLKELQIPIEHKLVREPTLTLSDIESVMESFGEYTFIHIPVDKGIGSEIQILNVKMSENINNQNRPNTAFLAKESREIKSPVIISQISQCLDSIDVDDYDECLMTVIELNDGIVKQDNSESGNKSLNEKPKKFRINLIKPKIDLEKRKSKLLEDKEIFEHRLKRFPGYIIGNLKCISQGDYESPVSSNTILEPLLNSSKVPGLLTTNITSLLPKIKSERIVRKIKYTVPEEAVKFYDELIDVKIKSEEDFDLNMMRKFPLGQTVIKEKFHLSIIYVPECDILRKQFIGFHGLNFQKLTNEDFENWCQKNALFNSKWMYESYFENGKPKECSFILKGLMTKYQVGIVISDFFRTQDFAIYRAIAVFGEVMSNLHQCTEEFKLKLPVNITPYLQENPDDATSLAPNDFEEIDYFRRNYHKLMFSEDVYF